MMFFYPKDPTLKFCNDISIKSMSGRGVKKGGTLRTLRVPDRTHGGLGNDVVIPDVMNDVILP